jgi:hypothetical protein
MAYLSSIGMLNAAAVCPISFEKKLSISTKFLSLPERRLANDVRMNLYSCDPDCIVCDACISFVVRDIENYYAMSFIKDELKSMTKISKADVFKECSGYNFVAISDLNGFPTIPGQLK